MPIFRQFRGALVYLGSTQPLASGSSVPLNFNLEGYDTDGIHDTVTNTSRLTVPEKSSLIRLSANVFIAGNSTGLRTLQISKNGGFIYNCIAREQLSVVGADPISMNITSSILEVIPGDYFQVSVVQNSTIPLNALGSDPGSSTWFAMEIIE